MRPQYQSGKFSRTSNGCHITDNCSWRRIPGPAVSRTGADGAEHGEGGDAPFDTGAEANPDLLNENQREIFDEVTAAVQSGKQLLMLVNGGPGTGKTYTMSQIVRSLKSIGLHCIATSFMWSAVYNLDVECVLMSIHALLKANANLNVEMQFLCKNWKKFRFIITIVEGKLLLVLDEISTTQPGLLVGHSSSDRSGCR